MKLLKHIIRAGALCGLLLTTAAAEAQTVQLKVMEWNVLSFEMTDKSNQIDFIVDEYVDLTRPRTPTSSASTSSRPAPAAWARRS